MAMHFSGLVTENMLSMAIDQLDGALLYKNHAHLYVIEDGLLFGKRITQSATHLIQLLGQMADFIGLFPVERMIQVAAGQLIGKIDEAG